MSKHDVVNRVVAYRLGTDATALCGLVIAVVGGDARLFEYAPVSDPSDHIAAVEKDLANESEYIRSCQHKLALLQREASSSPGTAANRDTKLREKWLRWAKDGLRRLPPGALMQLTESQPSASGRVVEVVTSAVTAVMKSDERAPAWAVVRQTFADPSLVDKLCALDERPMLRTLYELVMAKFYTNSHFNLQEATDHSAALGALHKWLTAYMDFQRSRLDAGVSLEDHQQREELVKGLSMAKERRDLMQEDTDLSKSGMLFRRTNRIKVIPFESIVKVVGDAPTRLGREFVIKGLVNIDSEDALTIVKATPRTTLATVVDASVPVRADAAAGLGRPEGGWRRRSGREAATRGETAVLPSAAPGDACSSGGAARRRLPQRSGPTPETPQPHEDAPTFTPTVTTVSKASAAAAAPTSARLSQAGQAGEAAKTATAQPALRPAVDATFETTAHANVHHALVAENARLRRQLAAAMNTHQGLQEQSRADLLSLQDELGRVCESHKGLLDDYTHLEARHDALVELASGLVGQRVEMEQAWRNERAGLRRDLLLAKAVLAVVREQAAAQRRAVQSTSAEAVNATSGEALKVTQRKSLCAGCGGPNGYCLSPRLRDTLLFTSEYLRGATAAINYSMSF